MRLFLSSAFLWASSLSSCFKAAAFMLKAPSSHCSKSRTKSLDVSFEISDFLVYDGKHRTLPTGADYDALCACYSTCPLEVPPTILPCSLPDDFPVGTYYRNGGACFEADDGTPAVHPFDSDGMVCAATFDPRNQRILFRNKFVETEGYVNDKRTGKMTQRGIFGTMRSGGIISNMFCAEFKNVANTNVVHVGDKLYALWEGGRPYVLDPLTLENVNGPGLAGETDLDGLLRNHGTMSAHPRYDPIKNVWITFGPNFDPLSMKSTLQLYELDNQTFRSTRKGRLTATFGGPSLIHDFIITENWMIFNLNKAKVSPIGGLRAILGLGAFVEFIDLDQEAEDTSLVLVPRSLFDDIEDGSRVKIDLLNDKRVKVISVPFHSNFHFSNGFEDENGQIVFESIQSLQRDILNPPDNNGAPLIENRAIWDWLYPTILTQFSLDVENECLTVGFAPQKLSSRTTEFPSIPLPLSTRRHRYIYALGSHNEIDGGSPEKRGSGPPYGSVMKIDSRDPTGNEVFVVEPYEFLGECSFVAKSGKDVTNPAEEDAGYLVAYLTNGRDMTTDLLVFDVEGRGTLEKGPVSRIPLPTFIPLGLHGGFASDVTFDFTNYES